jgi:hypothetical protein
MPDEDVVHNGADVEVAVSVPTSDEAKAAAEEIGSRCKGAGLPFDQTVGPFAGLKVGVRSGRDFRSVFLLSDDEIISFSKVAFEKWSFLSGYEAICSYDEGLIEAGFQQSSNFLPSSLILGRLFGTSTRMGEPVDVSAIRLALASPQGGFPHVEVSPASEIFQMLTRFARRPRLTLKLGGCAVAQHDKALSLLQKVAGPIFFQIDMLTEVPITVERERRRHIGTRKVRKKVDLSAALQYPKTEFDDAPLSLYWYGRSASGMPLLQFLAFYQVLEFYFPIYSQSEAQRKLKTILKDPTFRGDRDSDVAKLLSAIQVSRSGGYGDERSQLRATLLECVDSASLREFLESEADRKEFYSGKNKYLQCHKIPLGNSNADLRADVAERLYEIRCKIVHTKGDSLSAEVEPVLPFSKEAEQLSFDIDLVQYLARKVLIAGSRPFQIGV